MSDPQFSSRGQESAPSPAMPSVLPAQSRPSQPQVLSMPGAQQAPASAPCYPVSFPTGEANKVHHSYIWLSSLIGLFLALFFGMITNVADIMRGLAYVSGDPATVLLVIGLFLLAVVVVYALMLGIAAWSYRHMSFVFDEKEFSFYSGIFTKRRVHVPYARVQSVNHKQSILQRLAGVCTVEIDTAGGAGNKAVKVPYVKLNVGEAIRSDLFVRKAACLVGAENQVSFIPSNMGAPASFAPPPASPAQAQGFPYAPPQAPAPHFEPFAMPGSAFHGYPADRENALDAAALDLGVEDFRGLYGGSFAGMEPASFERRLDNKELLLASISNSSVGATAVVMFFLLFGSGLLLALVDFASAVGMMALTIPMLAGLFVISVVFSVGGTALSFGSFIVRRRGTRIEVERGILQRDFSGIDVDRIQSLVVRQSFVRRMLGYCEVSLGRVKAGNAEDQNTQAKLNSAGLVVHPFLRLEEVDSLLAGLLPEYAERPTSLDFKGLPSVALRRGFLRRCLWRSPYFWMAAAAFVFQLLANTLLAGGPLFGTRGVLSGINIACVALYALCVMGTAFIALGTLWWKRGSGFAMNERYLAVCNDGLSTETIYLPRQKIQDVLVRTNPFQRMARVCTIGALTAAGVGGMHSVLWDVAEEDGRAWLDWLKPRVHVVQ